MPDTIEEDDALKVFRALPTMAEEDKPWAADLLSRYEKQQTAAGRKLWPKEEQRRIDVETQLRKNFSDPVSFGLDRDRLDQLNEAARATPNPDESKRGAFVKSFLAQRYGVDPKEVAGALPGYLSDYAKREWGKDGIDISTAFDKIAGDYRMQDNIGKAALESAWNGQPQEQAFGQFLAEAKNGTDYNPMHDKDYKEQFSKAHQSMKDALSRLKPIESDVALALQKGDWETAVGIMKPLSEADTGVVMRMLNDRGVNADKPLGEQSAQAVGRSIRDTWKNAASFYDKANLAQVNPVVGQWVPNEVADKGPGAILDYNLQQLHTGQMSLIGQGAGGSGSAGADMFHPRPGRNLTEEDVSAINAEIGKRIDNAEAVKQMIGIHDTVMDPVRGENWFTQHMYYPTLSATGFMSAAMIPGGAGLAVAGYSMADDEYSRLRQMGVSHEQAMTNAVVVGSINAGLLELKTNVLLAKFPMLAKALGNPVPTLGQSAAKFGIRAAQDSVGAATIMGMQELVPALVQDITGAGGGTHWLSYTDNAGKQQDGVFIQAAKHFPESIAGMFLLGAIGAGAAHVDDVSNARKLLQESKLMRVFIDDDAKVNEVRMLSLKGDIAGAADLFRQYAAKAINEGTTLDDAKRQALQSVRDKVQRFQQARAAADSYLIDAPAVKREDVGFVLHFPDGTKSAPFENAAAAEQAKWQHVQETDGYVPMETTRELFQAAAQGLNPGDVLRLKMEMVPKEGKDVASAEEVKLRAQQEDALTNGQTVDGEHRVAVALVEGVTHSTEDSAPAMIVLGENATSFAQGVRDITVKLFPGGIDNPLVIAEEIAETHVKSLIDAGHRDWLLSALREYENGTGTTLFRTNDDAQINNKDLVEAFSAMATSVFLGRTGEGEGVDQYASMRGKGLRETLRELMDYKVGGVINAMGQKYLAAFKRAAVIEKARKEGKIDEKLLAQIEKSLGLGGDRADVAGVLKAAEDLKRAATTGPDTTHSVMQLREDFKNTSLITTAHARLMLGDMPTYLREVADFMARQRTKAVTGKFTPRDIAKAYLMTLGSIGASSHLVPKFERNTGLKVPERFKTVEKGKEKIRPEEAVALWLGTPDGKAALDSIDRGEVDLQTLSKTLAPLISVRDTYGRNEIRRNGLRVNTKKATMTDIVRLTSEINAAKGDVDKIDKIVRTMSGIGSGKLGFVKHLLGFGDSPTIDAVEINYWLTGKGSTGQLDNARADLVRRLKADGGSKLMEEVGTRIGRQIDKLAKQYGLPPEIGAHIVHHWIWDAAKKVETTHSGMMHAMESFSMMPKGTPEEQKKIADVFYRDRAGDGAGAPLTETEVREGIEDASGTIADFDIDDAAFDNAPSVTQTDDRSFSMSRGVPLISRKALAGKKKFIYFSDRTRVGVYTGLDPDSGIRIDLQGGPEYPWLTGHAGDAGWAFTDPDMYKRFMNRVNATDGIGLTTLYAPENLRANWTFTHAYVAEVEHAIKKGTLKLKDFMEGANEIREAALTTSTFTPKADYAKLWNEKWKTIEDFKTAMLAATFEVRAQLAFAWDGKMNRAAKLGKIGNLKKGFPDVTKMVELFADPRLRHIPTGTIVGAVQFTKGDPHKPLDAKTVGAEEHLSYPVVAMGKGIGWFSDPAHVLDVIGREPGKRERDQVRSAETSMADAMFSHSMLPGEIPDKIREMFDPFNRSPELRARLGLEMQRRAIAAARDWDKVKSPEADISKLEAALLDKLDILTADHANAMAEREKNRGDQVAATEEKHANALLSHDADAQAAIEEAKHEKEIDIAGLRSEGASKADIEKMRRSHDVKIAKLQADLKAQRTKLEADHAAEVAAINAQHDKAASDAQTRYEKAGKAAQEQHAEAVDQAQKKAEAASRTERMMAALRTLDAIQSALPAEVRGKLGPSTALAALTTDEARLKEIERKTERINTELERYLRADFSEKFKDLLDRAEPGNNKPGEKQMGKIGVEGHRFFDRVREVHELSEEEVADQMAAIEAKIVDPLTTDEERTALTERWGILRTFGDFGSLSAAEMNDALEMARKVYTQGREAWKAVLEDRKADRDAKAATAIAELGAPDGSRAHRDAIHEERESGQWGRLKQFIGNAHLNFGARMARLFGWESKTATHYETEVMHAFHAKNAEIIRLRREWRDAMLKIFGEEKWSGVVDKLLALQQTRGDSGVYKEEGRVTIKQSIPEDAADKLLAGKIDPKTFDLTKDDMDTLRRLRDERDAANQDALQKHFQKEQEIAAAKAKWSTAIDAETDKDAQKKLREQRDAELAQITGNYDSFREQRGNFAFDSVRPGKLEEQRLSQLQAVHLTMLARQEQYRKAMDYHGWTEHSLKHLEAFLSPEAKAIRDWLSEQYEAGYDSLNAVYQQMFGIDLPKVRDYAPGYFETSAAPKESDPLGSGVDAAGIAAGFLKKRKNHLAEPKVVDALEAYWTHVASTEHWKAFAPLINEMRSVLQRVDVRKMIETKGGERASKDIANWIEAFEKNGVRTAQSNAWMGRFTSALTRVMLGYKMGTLLKHAPNGMSSLAEVPAMPWMRGFGKVLTGQLNDTIKMLWENDMIRHRIELSYAPDLKQAMRGDKARPSSIADFMDWGVARIPWVSAAFTTVSAAIAHDYHLSEAMKEVSAGRMTEADAHALALEKTALTVARTAMPETLDRKSLAEIDRTGVGRLALLFHTPERAQWGLAFQALAMMGDGKNGTMTRGEAMRRLVATWIVAPALTQTMSSLAMYLFTDKDAEDAWNWKRYAGAIALGPMSGVFGLGQVAEAAAHHFLGASGSKAGNPLEQAADTVFKAGDSLVKWMHHEEKFDPKSVAELGTNLGVLTSTATDLPVEVGGVVWNILKQAFGLIGTVDQIAEDGGKKPATHKKH